MARRAERMSAAHALDPQATGEAMRSFIADEDRWGKFHVCTP